MQNISPEHELAKMLQTSAQQFCDILQVSMTTVKSYCDTISINPARNHSRSHHGWRSSQSLGINHAASSSSSSLVSEPGLENNRILAK